MSEPTIKIEGDDQVEYGWSLTRDSEVVNGPVAGLVRTVLVGFEANEGPCEVFIGRKEPPTVNFDSIVDTVIDEVYAQLEDQVGEVAENFALDESQRADLAQAIRERVEAAGYHCWRCVDMQRYGPGDDAYEHAVGIWNERNQESK